MPSKTAIGNAKPATSLWIYNPALDLLVGCGAWSVPLLGLAYLTATQNTLAWSVAFYSLALFFNYPHYMATLYRAYHRAEDFQKYRIFTVHITALMALTLLLSHFWFRALPWIFTLYLCWSPWHYSGQNYGLCMMFARRAGARPSSLARRALYGAFLLSYAILLINFHTGVSNDPLFLSLGIPAKLGSVAVELLAVSFLALSAFALSRLIAQVGWRPLLPALTLFSTQFVWFLLPTALAFAKGLQLPQSRYSTGVLAVMHSAQYLWITSYYARREATADASSHWRPFAYFGVLVMGGVALFVPGPWIASRLFHYDFTASFLIFTALVNIHHFILDGAIWKLRDDRIAALLLNSQQRIQEANQRAGSRILSATRWLSGSTDLARSLQISAAILLITVASIDQVRFYLALHAENLADLTLAAKLNATDSALQSRIGRQEFAAGHTDNAIAHWNSAMQANPSAQVPRDALLQVLSSKQRYQEAFQLTTRSLPYSPKDVNLLINRGVLAHQLGHAQEAIASWTEAVTLEPGQSYAHLYLAGELDHQGKPTEAIPHYVIFLEQVARVQRQDDAQAPPPPVSQIVPIVLQLAQCQSQVNRTEQAEKSYELARHLAVQGRDAKSEALADAVQADFEATHSNSSSAMLLYQHALHLDAALNDAQAEASDWFSYGTFLRDHGFPVNLADACLQKAESLLRSSKPEAQNAEQLKSISLARSEMERRGAVSQEKLQAALDEALHLPVGK